MSLTKSQTFYSHNNCKHLPLKRECFQRHNVYSVVCPSFHVGNLNSSSHKRSVVARFVMSSRAQVKRPAHHGKSKKDSKEQQGNILKNTKKVDSSGLILTDSLGIGRSSSAPADFCTMEEELDELDEDDELQIYRGLVLDLTYRPINVVSWKRALCLDVMDRADVLEYYDQTVVAVSKSYYIPAVLRVSSFVHAPKGKKVKLTLNRNNIFLRDKFRCQYCNKRGEDLTVDHVLAASRGGGWEWENLVTACSTCNVKKGDKSLEECRMKLLKQPKEPKELDSSDLPPNYRTFRVLHRNKSTPAEWMDYLPKQISLF